MRFNLLKKGAILLIVLILIIGTVACNVKEPAKSGVLEPDYQVDISGEVVFTVDVSSATEAAAPKAFAKAFEKKYPGVKVTVDQSSRGTYATRISTGEIGDVFWCDEADANNYKRNHNALLMLDYYLEKLDIDVSNVYNGAYQSGVIDGRLYMVPRNMGQMVLLYNQDAVIQAGLSLPSGTEAMSWEDFKTICRQLTLSENGETVQVGASFRIWWTCVWQAFAEGWGGKWCDAVNKQVTFVSDEKVMQGLTEMFDAITEGWMVMEDVNGGSILGIPNQNRIFRTFADMQWVTSWGNEYDNKDIAWDLCPFPAFPSHKVCAGATGYVVYNRTTNPDAAAALALFFLTEEGQTAYHSTTGGNVPLLKSLAEETFWQLPDSDWSDKSFGAFVSHPDATIPAVVIVRAPYEISEILSNTNMDKYFNEIINGTRSVEDVFTELERTCNETWSTLTEF